MIFLQDRHQLGRQYLGAAVVFPVVIFEEKVGQFLDVAPPFSQRGQCQIHHVDAVKQILPERAIFNFIFQDSIGGANHAHFNFFVFLRADAAELAVLQ